MRRFAIGEPTARHVVVAGAGIKAVVTGCDVIKIARRQAVKCFESLRGTRRAIQGCATKGDTSLVGDGDQARPAGAAQAGSKATVAEAALEVGIRSAIFAGIEDMLGSVRSPVV